MIYWFPTAITASAVIYTGPCLFGGVLIGGMDGVNDPTVTVYDGVDNTGKEITPTATYDASGLNLNGVRGGDADVCFTGIYVEITGGAPVTVVTRHSPR